MDDHDDQDIPDQYLCPITRQVMQDPVVIQTGRSYERKVILEWFARGRTTDPFTNQVLASNKVIPNMNLKQLIQKLPEEKRKIQEMKDYQYALKVLEESWGLAGTPGGNSEKGIQKEKEKFSKMGIGLGNKKQKQQDNKIHAKSIERQINKDLGNKAFFDLSIDGENAGRIVFQLFDEIVPKTTQNFKVFCTRTQPEGYKGSKFHRIINQFMAQGGDFTKGNGTGTTSIYGARFDDENFIVKHDQKYLLSMANAGKNTNGSQFFITFVACPWLDGKHTVFGKVIDGQNIVDQIERRCGTPSGKPKVEVVIVDCGVYY